jgi:hypothetical protein
MQTSTCRGPQRELIAWNTAGSSIQSCRSTTDLDSRSAPGAVGSYMCTYAIQAFAEDKRDLVVHVRMDNSTAVAYVNHMGGTKSSRLCSMTKNLWDWCLQRHLIIVASHITGSQDSTSKKSQSVCRMVHLRQSYQGAGISDEATALLPASWRSSTTKKLQLFLESVGAMVRSVKHQSNFSLCEWYSKLSSLSVSPGKTV